MNDSLISISLMAIMFYTIYKTFELFNGESTNTRRVEYYSGSNKDVHIISGTDVTFEIDGEKYTGKTLKINRCSNQVQFPVKIIGSVQEINTVGRVDVHDGNSGNINTTGAVSVNGNSGSINTIGSVKVTGDVSGYIETVGKVTR